MESTTTSDLSNKTSSILVPICSACSDEHLALYKCLECDEFYCEFMATAHMRMKAMKTHQVVSIPTGDLHSIVCKDHKEISKYYDSFCNRLVCRDCVVLEHMGHKCIGLDVGRKMLEKKLSDIQSRSIETIMLLRNNLKSIQEQSMELDKLFADCESHLRADFEKFIHELKQKEIEMHSSLKAAYDAQKGVITDNWNAVSAEIDDEEAKWAKLEDVKTKLQPMSHNILHNIHAIQLLTESLQSASTINALPKSNTVCNNATLPTLLITESTKDLLLACIEGLNTPLNAINVKTKVDKGTEEEESKNDKQITSTATSDESDHEKAVVINHIPEQESKRQDLEEGSEIICSAAGDNVLKIWNVYTGSCLQTFTGHAARVRCVIQLHDGRLASCGDDHMIKLWDVSTASCLQTLVAHTNLIYSLTQLSTGQLCSASFDNTIRIWDISTTNTCSCIQTLNGHINWVFRVIEVPALVQHQPEIVSCSADNTIKLWDIAAGQCIQTFMGHLKPVVTIASIPTTTRIVSGSEDNSIKIWDLSTAQCLQTLSGHTSRVTTVKILQDGSLISTSCDMTMKVWNMQTYECIATLQGHSHYVLTVCELSNGYLCSGSTDTTIKVWSREDGAFTCIATLQGHSQSVCSIIQIRQ